MVEDKCVNQMVIGALLKQLSVKTTLTSSGLEALALLEDRKLAPDVILMDCEMPDLDGYQTTGLIRELESRENRPRTPVLALTAHASNDTRSGALPAAWTITFKTRDTGSIEKKAANGLLPRASE